MTSPVWQATVTDDTGDVLPGAQIDVVIESTGTDATLFSNRSGTTSLSNPFFADSEGFAQFYTDAGAYRITATASGGGTTRTWRYVSLFDFDANVGTAAGEVPLNSDLGTASLVDAIGSGDLYGRDSILGTVSETAGVPTGAIIESGSNSDGEYTKWADGTQICTGFDPVGVTTSTARDNVYFATKSAIDFPHDFVGDIPVAAVSGVRDGVSPVAGGFFWPAISEPGSVTLTTINYGIIGTNDSVVGSYQYIAVGRWFT